MEEEVSSQGCNQLIIVRVCQVASVVSDSARPYGLLGSLCPWDSPGKNTGMGCHALFQGIEPASLMSPELAGGFFTTSAIWEALKQSAHCHKCEVLT